MAEAEKSERLQFSLLTMFVVALLAGGVLGISVAIYKVIQDDGNAAQTRHATDSAFRVVERFMEAHPGQWPQSWRELETVKDPSTGKPMDLYTIQRRVKIDFTLGLEDLEKQSESTFTAIQAIGPTYSDSESANQANQIIELAKKYVKLQAHAPVSQK